MNSIALKTNLVKTALSSYSKATNVVANDSEDVTKVSLTNDSKEFLQHLLTNIKLTATQQTKISKFLLGATDFGSIVVGNIDELFDRLSIVNNSSEPILEIKINDKWYPVLSSIRKIKTMFGQNVELYCIGFIGTSAYTKYLYAGEFTFKDPGDKHIKRTLSSILEEQQFRFTTKEALEHSKEVNSKVLKYAAKDGKVFDVVGNGLAYNDYYGWGEVTVGSLASPAIAVTESTLEKETTDRIYDNMGYPLPFVRVFSFKHKQYVYVDIEDFRDHVFHREGKDKIVLPKDIMFALESIFNADSNKVFGDLFNNRHGGIVVLANGNSGCGKTLSAEVFAEYQERPLYSMEISEVGTTARDVEENLQKIFTRAKKWNAVLLFDEADIFLSERAASELERSAIVGIFLRLLDYYEGTFFLTTNRGEGIDKAFKSRVTLYLNYPDLSVETRETIWKNMLSAANLTTVEDQVTMRDIAEVDLNGRQIRNQVRLLKLMYNNIVTCSNIKGSLNFTAR